MPSRTTALCAWCRSRTELVSCEPCRRSVQWTRATADRMKVLPADVPLGGVSSRSSERPNCYKLFLIASTRRLLGPEIKSGVTPVGHDRYSNVRSRIKSIGEAELIVSRGSHAGGTNNRSAEGLFGASEVAAPEKARLRMVPRLQPTLSARCAKPLGAVELDLASSLE